MAEPPPPSFPDRFFKLPTVRPRPLQRRILEYLSRGGSPSISAISTALDVWRFSVQRSLKAMKRDGSVKDQWIMFALGVVPGIKAHTFHITDRGRGELKLLQSMANPTESIPLGWRILLYMSHGGLMTIGQIAKMLGKDRGHVGRVIKSHRRATLVDCLYSKTRTSFGQDMITHLYRITDLGKQMLEAGPDVYFQNIRKPCQRRGYSQTTWHNDLG